MKKCGMSIVSLVESLISALGGDYMHDRRSNANAAGYSASGRGRTIYSSGNNNYSRGGRSDQGWDQVRSTHATRAEPRPLDLLPKARRGETTWQARLGEVRLAKMG